MPRYLVTLSETDPDAWLTASPEDQEKVFAQHRAFEAALETRGEKVAGAALAGVEEQRTLRHTNGEWAITDGPYTETAEHLTGVYLVDQPDLDSVLDVCRLLPHGYLVSVRPTIEIEGYDE